MRLAVLGLAAAVLVAGCATPAETAATPAAAAPTRYPIQLFEVALAPPVTQSASGRLVIFARPWAQAAPTGAMPQSVRGQGSDPVAATDIAYLAPGGAELVNADAEAYPVPMSKIPAGEYAVQAVLDVDGNIGYSGGALSPPDLVSPVYRLQLPGGIPYIELSPRPDAAALAASAARYGQPAAPADDVSREFQAHLRPIDFTSTALSEFWGKPIHIRGFVLLPPDYETSRTTYPTVYRAEGFGGTISTLPFAARQHYALMKSGDTPPMIRVFLDHSSPWGTHEFADSVNNGPWGTALTEELIPALEKQYRMDAEPSGRFTTGHSSGGWFAIWQQVRYPNVYGGTWARSPDPVDFRSFTGIDIYRDGANAYVRPDGTAQYLVRDATGKEVTSFKEYTQRENVLAEYGGQIDSFDWVFSPRGQDGRPQPLFDRATGKIDPQVARYWRDHFDISRIIRRDWASLKPVLDGKIHLMIGTMDTFHLNEAARILDLEMQVLGADADFYYMEGRTHGNIDRIGDDPQGLEKKIAWEMWAVARPDSKLKPKLVVAPEIVRNPSPPVP